MSILEFATFSIKSPHTIDTPELKSALQNALRVLKKASGFTFNLLHQVEDTSVLYLLGSWTSVEAHNEFLVSPENITLLDTVKDLINVDLLFHAEIEKATLPLDAPCIALSRVIIKAGKKEEFEEMWGMARSYVAEYTNPYPFIGGWRVDGVPKEIGGEWLQFAGFLSVEHHHAVPKAVSTEYGKVMGLVEKYQPLGHAKALDW